jgi:multidrug resistance efflux pump
MTAETQDGAAPKRGIPKPLIVLLLVGLVGGGGYLGYHRWKATQPLEWSGTIEARTIAIGSRTGGRVKEVHVREGDHVEAGQVIVTLEAGDLEAQRLIAEAQVETAQASLDKLQNGARPEEIEQAKARSGTAEAALAELKHGPRAEEVAAQNARVSGAQTAVDKAQLDVDRVKKLYDGGAVSKSELDAVNTALAAAVAQRDAAKETLKQIQSGARKEQIDQAAKRAEEAKAGAKLVESGARIEDIRAATAQLKAAQGRLEQVKVNIAELEVRAPRAARIETLVLRPGDLVAPGARAAVLLEDDQLFVRVYVPETQLGHAHLGDQLPVFVDTFPDRAFDGTVEQIDMQGQYSPRNLQTADERANQVFAMRVGLRGDATSELRAGMAALVKVRPNVDVGGAR